MWCTWNMYPYSPWYILVYTSVQHQPFYWSEDFVTLSFILCWFFFPHLLRVTRTSLTKSILLSSFSHSTFLLYKPISPLSIISQQCFLADNKGMSTKSRKRHFNKNKNSFRNTKNTGDGNDSFAYLAKTDLFCLPVPIYPTTQYGNCSGFPPLKW